MPTPSSPPPPPSISTPHIAETLLTRAHPSPSNTTAQTIFQEKVHQRPLRLTPSAPDPSLNARSKRQHQRLLKTRQKQRQAQHKKKTHTSSGAAHPPPLSAREKRAQNIYEIPRAQQKYTLYEPLHELWCGYMREILGFAEPESTDAKTRSPHLAKKTYVDAATAGPVLVSADYHGALFTVMRCRCTSRVGLKGIVLRETKFTFEMVTHGNCVKVVPKEGTVFRFEVPLQGKGERTEDGVEKRAEGGRGGDEETSSKNDKQQQNEQRPTQLQQDQSSSAEPPRPRPLVFELYGSQFLVRAPDRAMRKFKMHIDDEL